MSEVARGWKLVSGFLAILAVACGIELAGAGTNPACTAVLGELQSGRRLSEETYRALGFRVDESARFSRALVLPVRDAEWASARVSAGRSLRGVRGDFEALGAPRPGLEPPRFRFEEGSGGFAARGHRYMAGEGGRMYRVDIIENIGRNADGNVTHYLSVQISEVGEGGSLTKIAYSDSPHIARGEARWFHAHDAATGDVVSEIATHGYTQSAVPDVLRWAREWLRGLP